MIDMSKDERGLEQRSENNSSDKERRDARERTTRGMGEEKGSNGEEEEEEEEEEENVFRGIFSSESEDDGRFEFVSMLGGCCGSK